jgi:hypothetical protein
MYTKPIPVIMDICESMTEEQVVRHLVLRRALLILCLTPVEKDSQYVARTSAANLIMTTEWINPVGRIRVNYTISPESCFAFQSKIHCLVFKVEIYLLFSRWRYRPE